MFTMAKTEITPMQREMENAFGHETKVILKGGGKSFTGKCVCFVPPLDNDPEVASIDIAVPNRFSDTGRSLYEITEGEIESITILD